MPVFSIVKSTFERGAEVAIARGTLLFFQIIQKME